MNDIIIQDYRNLILTTFLIFSDAFWYGIAYQYKGWFKAWLFLEVNYEFYLPYYDKTFKGSIVPFYRLLIQWPLDLFALYLVWLQGWKPFAGMLIAWYFLVKEGGFYTVLLQWKNLKADEILEKDMYWLKRWYFAGKWLFKNTFTVKKFAISCIIGLIILIISNFI